MISKYEKTNGVKLLAVVAVLAMVVCAFAAVMPAEETEAATGDTQYYSGTLDKLQEFTSGTNVIIDKDLTIKSTTTTTSGAEPTTSTTYGLLFIEGSTVTINSGVTITVEKDGCLYFGTGSTIVNNGTINVKNGGFFYNASADDDETADKTEGITNNGTIEIQRGGTLDGKTVAPGQNNGKPAPGNVAAGSILVSADGSIKSLGTKTTPSFFNNQNISIAVGATVDLTSKINGVTVDSDVGTGVYTYGSVAFVMGDGASDNQANQEITNVSFSVTSERIADAYLGKAYSTAESYARANAFILDISGSLGAYTDATVKANPAVTADGNLLFMKDYDTDKAINVQIKGTVSITGNFDVNANTGFTVDEYAIVNVSGSIDVAGKAATSNTSDDAALAKLDLKGIINVSGQVTIDSVAAKTAGGTVNLVAGNDNIKKAYLNIIGEGEITIEDYAFNEDYTNAPLGVNGVTYTDKDDVFHVTNLDKAVAGATSENNGDEITIWGYNFGRGNVAYTNPYVINADYAFPEDLTVNVEGYAIIAEGATVTVPESASLTGGNSVAKLIVEGALMDYTMAADEAAFTLTADVRTIDADETYYLYTSLKAALADANEGDTIELFGANVNIEENLTIQSGVTVDVSGKTLTVAKNTTLTIDGVLDLSTNSNSKLILTDVGDSTSDRDGSVVLNNMIVVTKVDTTGVITGTVPGFYVVGDVGETVGGNYIMAPAVAAANSATLTEVTVKGDVSYNGDLAFTAGEDNEETSIAINGSKVSISKIIIDGYTVNVAGTSQFTGTVEATTTAGVSSVTLNKSGNAAISVFEDDSGEQTVTEMIINKTGTGAITGGVTISAGSVTLKDTTVGFGASRDNVLNVAAGATFIVDGQVIYLKAPSAEKYDNAIVVDGTIVMDNAQFTPENGCKAVQINGTMQVIGDLSINAGIKIVVGGTIAVSEVEDEEGKLIVNGGTVAVGTAPETLGANGSITGPVQITTGNYITVYAGSSVETAKLNVNATSGESDAVATEFFINGTLYMTVYAYGEVAMVDNFFAGFGGFEIVGYDTDNAVKAEYWFTTADYQKGTALDANAAVGAEGYEAVYFKAPALNGYVTYSVGSQISLYVDGVKVTSGTTVTLSVGTHTVTATVNPGYTGDVTITFNGQTITGGTFEVTPEMNDTTSETKGVVLSATGNITVDTGSTGGDDGMGLTEILLVILVILIVVMAIMVALRLMRS